jgi:primosomal protein N' (replication factor Y)
MPLFCEVALPVPLRQTFTFSIPAELKDKDLVGGRVLAPFRRRPMVGVCLSVSETAPDLPGVEFKPLTGLLDTIPALTPRLIELGRWVSSYYLAPIGECFRAMLPPQAEIRNDREYRLTAVGAARLEALESALGDKANGGGGTGGAGERAVLQLFEDPESALKAARLRKRDGAEEEAERLVRKGVLAASEVARRKQGRTRQIVAWNEGAAAGEGDEEARVKELLSSVRGPLPSAVLLKEARVSRAKLARMVKEGKLEAWKEPAVSEAENDGWETGFVPAENVLNAEQEAALDGIRGWLKAGRFTAALLHGVTGSGKTEVYFGAIEAALAEGRQALILVPEIALTLWLGRLMRARFGPEVAVLHSGLPESERSREWWRARRGEARIVVGTRSAVFAPLENPGLIIIDEEQESSYKQEETPRYHGRDTAIMRAKLEGAVALAGSATPSLESFHNARAGKYKLLELRRRVENRPLATVRVVDLREDFRRSGRPTPVSEELRTAIAARLEGGTQTLVLINRRGYSWFLLCRSCGYSLECENCSISLTFHKRRDRLECHYCGYSRRAPPDCPKCKSEHLYFVGDGAERVEEYLREQFPGARVGRLDRDTVRTKKDFQKVLGAFAAGRIDVLVGTQMVAKGHDFERVTLVGVVAADIALGRPDFRAAERTFQLLTQVAGRAGRGKFPGEVLVETWHSEHYAIQEAVRQKYEAFYEREVHFRRMMHYPPFSALAAVHIHHRKLESASQWGRELASYFMRGGEESLRVLGPAAAPLSRLRQEYRFQILLKSPQRTVLQRALAGALEFCEKKHIPETSVLIDVDPASLF